jgi:hypothetical protein
MHPCSNRNQRTYQQQSYEPFFYSLIFCYKRLLELYHIHHMNGKRDLSEGARRGGGTTV